MTNARLHLAAVTAIATTATTLFALHPPALAGAGGLPLGIALAWIVVTGVSAWLAVSSGAALLAVVCPRLAPSPVARFAPAFVRRLVEVALVGSCIVGSAVPASATSWRTRHDVPVVRAPAAVTTTTSPTTQPRPARPTPTTAAAPAPRPTAPTATTPSTATPAPAPSAHETQTRKERSRPVVTPEPAVVTPEPAVVTPEPALIPHASRRYTVRPGDNLWSIARGALGGTADDAVVATYWNALIAANRGRLRSGDPNLIYPGEVLGLPDRGPNQ